MELLLTLVSSQRTQNNSENILLIKIKSSKSFCMFYKDTFNKDIFKYNLEKQLCIIIDSVIGHKPI